MSRPVSPLRPERVYRPAIALLFYCRRNRRRCPGQIRQPKTMAPSFCCLYWFLGIWHHIPGLGFGIESDLVRLVSRLVLTL